MSYEPFPQGIYLLVKYHGSKAAQYFTKEFNLTSDSVFRRDLSQMKLPHPRFVNTRLAPGALVITWWPDVSPTTHDTLYSTLKKCTNAASLAVLGQLSISLLAVREIEALGETPMLLAYAKQDNVLLPTLCGLPLPTKRRKLDTDSFQKVDSSDRHYVPSSSAGIISTSQKRTWDGQLIPSKALNIVPQQTEVLSSTPPPRPMAHALPPKPQIVPPPTARTSAEPVKRRREPYPLDRITDQASDLNPASGSSGEPLASSLNLSEEAELETLRKRVGLMKEILCQQVNMKVRLDETANKLEAEQARRKKLEETAATAKKGETDARRLLEEAQKILAEERLRRFEANEHTASLQRDLLGYQDMARRQSDDFARDYARMQNALSLMEDELNVARPELKRVERDLQEEKARRRRYQNRLARAERKEAAFKQRCDDAIQEIASLTRAQQTAELDARAVQERRDEEQRLREELTQAQYTIIEKAECAMYAAQNSEAALRDRFEEVGDQLGKVESQLKTEMRLRREAEDAIADIRRECKEPFVVPSLLDAFVELAKLTTAATTSGDLI